MFFVEGFGDLWRSDGTEEGTWPVAESCIGIGAFNVTATDSQVFLINETDALGRELYRVVVDSQVPDVSNFNLGEFDGNGQVSFSGFLVLSTNFGAQTDDNALGDADDDGMVGFSDFLILAANFGTSLNPGL